MKTSPAEHNLDGEIDQMSESKQVSSFNSNADKEIPYFSDLRFREIFQEWQEQKLLLGELGAIIRGSRYAINDANTLKAVLEDASMLYDLAAGKERASGLLAALEKHIDPAVFHTIIVDLAEFIAPRLAAFTSALLDAGQQDPAKLKAFEALTAANEWEAARPVLESRMEMSKVFAYREQIRSAIN